MSTYFPSSHDITRKWFVVDASGKTLGRLATEAARWPLRDAFERVGLERVVSVAMVRGWCSMGCRERNTRKR